MSDDLIERLRVRNHPAHMESMYDGRCDACAIRWPCSEAESDMDRAEAADEIERLEEAARRLDVLLGVCSNAVRSGIDSWCGVHRCFVSDDLQQDQRVCEARLVLNQIVWIDDEDGA